MKGHLMLSFTNLCCGKVCMEGLYISHISYFIKAGFSVNISDFFLCFFVYLFVCGTFGIMRSAFKSLHALESRVQSTQSSPLLHMDTVFKNMLYFINPRIKGG